jgi:hypothetical protein
MEPAERVTESVACRFRHPFRGFPTMTRSVGVPGLRSTPPGLRFTRGYGSVTRSAGSIRRTARRHPRVALHPLRGLRSTRGYGSAAPPGLNGARSPRRMTTTKQDHLGQRNGP